MKAALKLLVLSVVSVSAAAAPKLGWGVEGASGLRVLPAFSTPAAVAGQVHKADCSLYPTSSAAGCVANALPAAKSTDRPDVSLSAQPASMCSDSRAAAGVKNCASHAIPLTFIEGASVNSARKPVHYDARTSSKLAAYLVTTDTTDGFDQLAPGDLDEDGTVAALMASLHSSPRAPGWC